MLGCGVGLANVFEYVPRVSSRKESLERLLVGIPGRCHRLDGGVRQDVESNQRRKGPVVVAVVESGVDEGLRVDDERTLVLVVEGAECASVDTLSEAANRAVERPVDLVSWGLAGQAGIAHHLPAENAI